VRALIFGGEYPSHLQHVQSVLDACDDQGVEYVFYIGNDEPRPGTFAPRNFFLHRLRDFLWDRFSWAPNRFKKGDFQWRGSDKNRTYSCKAIKGSLPWKPDVVIVVTPHEGHAKYQLIPWANREKIPVLSIDHGMPTVAWNWGTYRGSMMGCTANAVWSDVCRDVNVEFGAPASKQIITGAPSLDRLDSVVERSDFCESHGIKSSKRILLMLGTHRYEVKDPTDSVFNEIIDTYSENDEYQLIYKPHPVEISTGTSLKIPNQVMLMTSQTEYLALVKAADVVISPATSVIVPAMAFRKPFINTIPMNCDGASQDSLGRLFGNLGDSVFSSKKMHEVVKGEVVVDELACDDVFNKFGYRRDGLNGSRVVSLARHLSSGESPNGWKYGE